MPKVRKCLDMHLYCVPSIYSTEWNILDPTSVESLSVLTEVFISNPIRLSAKPSKQRGIGLTVHFISKTLYIVPRLVKSHPNQITSVHGLRGSGSQCSPWHPGLHGLEHPPNRDRIGRLENVEAHLSPSSSVSTQGISCCTSASCRWRVKTRILQLHHENQPIQAHSELSSSTRHQKFHTSRCPGSDGVFVPGSQTLRWATGCKAPDVLMICLHYLGGKGIRVSVLVCWSRQW